MVNLLPPALIFRGRKEISGPASAFYIIASEKKKCKKKERAQKDASGEKAGAGPFLFLSHGVLENTLTAGAHRFRT